MSFLRAVALFLLTLFLVAGILQASPDWFADLGLDLWDLPRQVDRLALERTRAEHLQGVFDEITHRDAEAAQLALEAARGKLTLMQAAARLKELVCYSPWIWNAFRRAVPGNSDEERLCRHLLLRVRLAFPESPGKGEREARRLEKELEGQLQAGTLSQALSAEHPTPHGGRCASALPASPAPPVWGEYR